MKLIELLITTVQQIFTKAYNIKTVNNKAKTLRAAREKKITYKGTPIRLSVDFSAETAQSRRARNDMFKILKNSQEYSIQ